MSQRSQIEGILGCRANLDDPYDGKVVFQFQPIQGVQDGKNSIFQIPQSRIVVSPAGFIPAVFPQIYVDQTALVFNTDYVMLAAKQGILQYSAGKIPTPENSVTCTFFWSWFDDLELDHHMMRGANKIGFSAYYTQPATIPGTEAIPTGDTAPADIPDGLFDAIIQMGTSLAAASLAMRFSMKYDFGAGDQNFSPSQMAKSYSELAKTQEKSALNARDDFYKSQGRQYKPVTAVNSGYILPNWTPPR
jgi:hypothetical protein